ncbi:MAG: hypothetical protein QOD86_962 [Miltoncostaeaceae bacterium]|jgi:hypothetical protein|nr:hypothetical protein [Miltoncostaeaceae bacterium]
MRLKAIGVVAVSALLVGGAGAAVAQEAGTVSAVGTSQVGVSPKDKKSEDSIRQAVEAARPQAVRLAIRNARSEARLMAEEAGLVLGPIVGISNSQSSPYGYGPYYFGSGRFGNNKYCGIVTRVVRRLNPATGKRVVVRRVRERKCFPPRYVPATVEVTFSATPPAL